MPRNVDPKLLSQANSSLSEINDLLEQIGKTDAGEAFEGILKPIKQMNSALKKLIPVLKKSGIALDNIDVDKFEGKIKDILKAFKRFKKDSNRDFVAALKNLQDDIKKTGLSADAATEYFEIFNKKAVKTSIGVNKLTEAIKKTEIWLKKLPKSLSQKQWDNFAKGAKKSEIQISALQNTVKRLRNDIQKKQEFLIDVKLKQSLGNIVDEKQIQNAQAEINKLQDNLEDIEDVVSNVSDTFSDLYDGLDDSGLKNLQDSFSALTAETSISEKQWQSFINVNKNSTANLGQVRKEFYANKQAIVDNTKEIDNLSKELLTNEKLTDDQKAAIREEIDELNNAKEKSIEYVGAISSLIKNSEDYVEAEKQKLRQVSLTAKVFGEAKDEADNFAGGLGKNATGLLAIGVALTYASTKVKELGENVLDSQRKWAEYNVELEKSSHIIPNFSGGVQGLDDLRKSLRLTRDEALAFNNVMKEASVSGVITTDRITEAATKLAETFGGDPTEMVREFVDLLKEIPTLETDLNITASLDKQTAAWFAIAEQGKVQQVIELQTAGLLGGEQEVSKEAEALKIQREVKVVQENIEKRLAELVPASIAYFTTTASVLLEAVGAIGSITTSVVAFANISKNILTSSQNQEAKLDDISNAIRGRKGIPTASKSNITLSSPKLPSQMKTEEGQLRRYRRLATAEGLKKKGVMGRAYSVKNLEKLDKGLLKSTGMLNKFGGGIKGILSNFGSTVGSSLGILGGGVGKIASMLGPVGIAAGVTVGAFSLMVKHSEFASKAWDKVTSKVSNAWSSLWETIGDSIFASKEELKAREENIASELELENQAMETAKRLKPMQDSALALQKSLSYIKASSETAITALSKLGQDVSKIKLDNLKLIGGSFSDFENALDDGVKNISDELNLMQAGFDKAREQILKDIKLNSTDRKSALLMLHKAELEAQAKFANALLEMAGKFGDIPSVAKADLENGMKQLFSDLNIEAGSDFFNRTFEDISSQIDNTMKELPNILSTFYTSTTKFVKAQDVLSNSVDFSGDKIKQELLAFANDLGETDLKAEILGTFDFENNVKVKEGKDEFFKQFQEKLQSRINKGEKILKSVDDNTLLDTLKQQQDELKKFQIEKNKLEVDEEKTEEIDPKGEKGELVLKKRREIIQQSIADVQKEIEIKGREIWLTEANIRDVAEKRLKETGELEGDERKLLEMGKEEIRKEEQQVFNAKNKLQKLKDLNEKLKEVGNYQKEQALLTQTQAKNVSGLVERFRVLISNIRNLSALIENDPSVQAYQRQIDILQEQKELAIIRGDSIDATSDLLNQEVGKYQQQIKIAKAVQNKLKILQAGGPKAEELLQSTGKAFEESAKIINEIFSAENMPDLRDRVGPLADIFKKRMLAANDKMAIAFKKIQEEFAKPKNLRNKEAVKSAKDSIMDAAEERQKIIEEADKRASARQKTKIDFTAVQSTTKVAEETVNVLNNIPAEMEKTNAKILKYEKEMVEASDRAWEAVVNQIDQSAFQRAQKSIEELGFSMLELATMTGDASKAGESYTMIVEAIYKAEQKASIELEKAVKKRKEKYAKDIADAKKQGKDTGVITSLYEKDIANYRAKGVQIEKNRISKLKTALDELAKPALRVLDLKQREVDLQRDVLETVGASVGLIMQNQAQELAVAKNRASIMKTLFDKAVADGLEGSDLEEKRLDYIQASADVTKKSMALQRDAYDKLLDKAFGAIRSERGAKKQLLSKAQMFGTGYVQQSATGLVVPGASKTLQQTTIERQMGAEEKRKRMSPAEKAADKQLEAANKMLEIPDKIKEVLDGLGPAVRTAVETGLSGLFGFAKGGYTGDGKKDEAAGVVHKGEYVVKSRYAKKYQGLLEKINKGEDIEGYANGGMVDKEADRAAVERVKKAQEADAMRRKEAMKKLEKNKQSIAQRDKESMERIKQKQIESQKRYEEMRDKARKIDSGEIASQEITPKMQKIIDKPEKEEFKGYRDIGTTYDKNRLSGVYDYGKWEVRKGGFKKEKKQQIIPKEKTPSYSYNRGMVANKTGANIKEQNITQPPITKKDIGSASYNASRSQQANVDVKANVSLKLDAEGNLKAMITKIVQQQVPSLIRSDPDTKNAIETLAATKNGA